MMPLIKLLPEHVANQIAAGEVIQRPASVVKELLDNSVDADSSFITLTIKDGGRSLVMVADNGNGMGELDARMAWERHATSKIAAAEDLFSLKTMGFRGEALASIASVAHVEMRTRQHIQDVGSRLVIEGSDVKLHEPASTQPGTVISVKNLFYNVPARRNFLKSNPVETRYVFDEFMRAALARPDIGFRLVNNEQEVYHLPTGSLQQRVLGLFADKKPEDLLPASVATEHVAVNGFVGSPHTARKNRGEQFLFVNGRFFKHPFLHHAIMSAYEELIPAGSFPLYVLQLLVNPASIDVNVHPQKTEIKFEDEKMMYAVVRSAVKQAIGGFLHTPEADFNTSFLFQQDESSTFSPPPAPPRPVTNAPTTKDREWKKVFDPYLNPSFADRFTQTEKPETVLPPRTVPQPTRANENLQVFQLFGRFVVAVTPANAYLIHQEQAHQRILYERYLNAASQRPAVQERLFPRVVELLPPDFELLADMLNDLNALGFDIAVFGKNTIIINGVPADIKNNNEQELLEGILNEYKSNLAELRDNRSENLARSAAKRAGIKAGTSLSIAEMEQLVRQLFDCHTSGLSPAGEPTFAKINAKDLETLLNRLTAKLA